ncbi:SDR family oxidoreductase [Buchnera aphidicola (Ceratovacuna keduensis)]|uniref:enoyl-ACP reductase FabI n=1 Tax=Buchnera aphidicola TaxID=9 RepID=UPI0031B82BCF
MKNKNLLFNKKILIMGIRNKFSIAYGIAKSMIFHKANLAITYFNKKDKKFIKNFAKKNNCKIILKCDVSSDISIKKLFFKLSKYWKKFDGFVHSIAFAPSIQFTKDYLDIIDRKSFILSHEISSYSLVALSKECKNMLNKNSSLLTISYLGSNIVVPNYNVMGPAKASLESNVKYIDYYFKKYDIRVNAISTNPIRTTSSYVIKNFFEIYNNSKKKILNKNNINIFQIGNIASFLCSNLSIGISGQIIHISNGLNNIF